MEKPITIDAVRLYNYTHTCIAAAGPFLHDQKGGQHGANKYKKRDEIEIYPLIIARNILLLLYAQVDAGY